MNIRLVKFVTESRWNDEVYINPEAVKSVTESMYNNGVCIRFIGGGYKIVQGTVESTVERLKFA